MFFKSKASGVSYIIVGLGNPEMKYDKTRHNAGFHAIDMVAEEAGVKIGRAKFKALTATATIAGEKCLLMKPQTYMNLSGEAVREAQQFYKVKNENILVLMDDISLPPSKMRIRRDGSPGGHNGIKSLISCLGGDNFPRIKLGVGERPSKDYDLADWVLSSFTADENVEMQKAYKACPDAVNLIVSGQTDKAMNKYNS